LGMRKLAGCLVLEGLPVRTGCLRLGAGGEGIDEQSAAAHLVQHPLLVVVLMVAVGERGRGWLWEGVGGMPCWRAEASSLMGVLVERAECRCRWGYMVTLRGKRLGASSACREW
jgi:hypothetical protein